MTLRYQILLAFLLFAVSSASSPAQSPAPASFASIDTLVQNAIDHNEAPGAVVLIAHNGHVLYRKAFGHRSLEPSVEPMTVDTIFDLASLTKCVATATAVMQLLEQGRIRLNDPVSAYLPEFAQNGKDQITIRQLLTHFSGLRPDIDLKPDWTGRPAAYDLIMREKPVNPPGARFVYSDTNFETLGFIVEKLTGQSLADYTLQHIYQPLGMKDTRFLPPSDWSPRIAPTQYDENGHMLRGAVHDPVARRMGGVAGHAGLFSTADDLAIFADALLHAGTHSGVSILSALSVEKMTTPQQPANSPNLRGLGWDIDSPFASNRGELLPVGSFGHTGFTGTSLWIDPTTDTTIILLTNAVHPRGNKPVVSLRARLATAVAAALQLTPTQDDNLRLARITGYNESLFAARRITARNGSVLNGIDLLEAANFTQLHPDPIHPIRIGLVTNQTGLDAHGVRTAHILAHVPGLQLAAIWSPEHGIAGQLDTTAIADSRDPATGAPIFSVYGDTDAKRRPTAAQLAQVDAILYDIQDIGVRFYTYESTLGYFLEAAAQAHKPIYVLDRPNPINGDTIEGPIPDPGRESFVSYAPIPVRHGMTIGELAQLFNAQPNLHANLTVIPMQGWQRGDTFDSTGQLWINPSPNMRSLTEATLYPGIGLIEGTNLSVSRGTDTPFELVGAPWIDGPALAHFLNDRQLEGIRFVPVRFTPTASNYAKEACGGVNLIVIDRSALDSVELGLEIISAIHLLYPNQLNLNALDGLLRNQSTLKSLQANDDPRRIAADWQQALDPFLTFRAKYLLY